MSSSARCRSRSGSSRVFPSARSTVRASSARRARTRPSGARPRADQLESLWNDLKLATPFHGRYAMPFGWPSISPARDMSLLGLPGFYAPRPDVWNFPRWTSIYDTSALKETLGKHVCFKRDRRQQDGICRFGSRCRLRHAEALPQCGGSREAPAAAGRGRRGRAVHRRAHHGERKPRAAVSVDQDRHAALLGRRHCRQHAAGRRDGGLFGRRSRSIGCWS